jgi:hypothetical protein
MLGDRWFVTWPSLERGDDLDMISFVVETFFERCDQVATSALRCKRNRARFIIVFFLRITPTERKNGKNSILRLIHDETRRHFIPLSLLSHPSMNFSRGPSISRCGECKARSFVLNLVFNQLSSKLFTSPGI